MTTMLTTMLSIKTKNNWQHFFIAELGEKAPLKPRRVEPAVRRHPWGRGGAGVVRSKEQETRGVGKTGEEMTKISIPLEVAGSRRN